MTMANYGSIKLYVLYSFNKSQDKVKDVSEKKYFVLGRLGNKYSDSTSIKSLPHTLSNDRPLISTLIKMDQTGFQHSQPMWQLFD